MDFASRFVIRKAESGDIPALTEFILMEALESEGRTPPRAIVTRGVRAAVEEGAVAAYWVVVDNYSNEIVASASISVEWSDWFAAPYWWIHSFYLVHGIRGLGLAQWLLAFLEKKATAAHAVELRLCVNQSNAPAIKAYQRAGFSERPYLVLGKELGDSE